MLKHISQSLGEVQGRFVPPVVENDAALSDGSGQVRAAGGASIGTSFHAKPSGASGVAIARQSSLGAGLNTVHAACSSPIAASMATPQKVNALVHCIGSSPKKSNLDMHDKLVSKGLTVSYFGIRYWVLKVSRGRCLVSQLLISGRLADGTEWLDCESVLVVGA